MKYKIGDKVRFLNEKGEGVITKIINKTTVGVTIEDGFELPFLETELVSIFDGSIQVTPVKQEVIEEPVAHYFTAKEERTEVAEGIYIAINPEQNNNISNTNFNLWLINHTTYEITYVISSLSNSGFDLIEKGDASAFESKLCETVDKKRIDIFNALKIEVLFFQSKKSFEHEAPVSEIIKIKTVKFYKENVFAENRFLPEKAYVICVKRFGEQLYFDTPESKNTDLSKLLFQKKSQRSAEKVSKPHRKNNPEFEMEVDIHIEELTDNWNGMSNAEIIQVQLRHFQNALDKAINEHYRTLTVIHGVGNGRLKQEVRNILTSMNLRFHDGSYSKYGFGATEVVIS